MAVPHRQTQMSLVVIVVLVFADVIARSDDEAPQDYDVQLKHMTSMKVPSYTEQGERLFSFGSGSVTKMSYDPFKRLLYTIGGPDLHAINVTKSNKLGIIGHLALPDVTFHDVTTCEEWVLTTYTQFNKSGLMVARGFQNGQQLSVRLLQILHDTTDPVAVAATPDCRTAVVAVDGKARWDGAEFVDHQPAVLVLNLAAMLGRETTGSDNQTAAAPVVVLDFREFDERSDELEKEGIRFPMKGRVGRMSQDMDPSDVTIDDVTGTAYVTLKTNNAVAVIDLSSKNVTKLMSLGLKDWREKDIDVCDHDGVHFQQQPIYSMFQAGAISLTRHIGATYLLTANTGAKRDYSHLINWSEAMTGSELVNNELVGSSVEPALMSALKNKSQLGSLEFSTRSGYDHHNDLGASKMTHFVAFGGRGFSLRELPDLDLVYDSGSDVEHRLASHAPEVFNCPVLKGSNVVRYDRDKTSILTGPEPISVTSGRLGSLTLLFVGLSNPGSVLMYSVPVGARRPRFESLWLGLRDALNSWNELYMKPGLAGIGVTDLIYVPSHLTGSGFPWLLVAGSKSGTVTVLKVEGTGDVPTFTSSADSLNISHWKRFVVGVMTTIVVCISSFV